MANKVIPTNMPQPSSAVGWDGTDFRIIKVDAAHHVQADVLSNALPADAATAANQTTEITALQKIDDLQNALHSVDTDELQVNVETSALPAGAATEATLAEVSARIGDETGPAAGSLNELLRVIETDLANLMLYDRGLVKVVNAYAAVLAAHAFTIRYTYTVPGARRALLEAVHLRASAPDTAHVVWLWVYVNSVVCVVLSVDPLSVMCMDKSINWSGGVWLTAGDTVIVATSSNSGTDVVFDACTIISEFNA